MDRILILAPLVSQRKVIRSCELFFTSGVMGSRLRNMNEIQIPFFEMEFTYVRSRGPGGQNVNRTNSAAILRWNLWSSQVLSDDLKEKLGRKLHGKLTEEGDLIVRSDVHRDQDQNRSECIRRLHEILKKALFVPKKRIATKPTRSSQRKRIEAKKHLGEIKSLRQKVRGSH